MTRDQLEHLIRAAAIIADDDTIVVIGSQAVLGQFPDAPEPMRVSMEADLFPLHHPERADLIEGSIGELSPFHQTFGYYAQGVAEETAVLPEGWRDRLVVVQNENTRGAKGLCLEVHDLLIAKVVAGDEPEVNLALVADLCETMTFGSACALGGLTPYPVMSAIKHFPKDFRAG